MPRKLFRRYLPDKQSLEKQGLASALGDRIHDPNLWHLNKHSVANAVAIGLFVSFFPFPMQMVAAAFMAFMFRGNLPLSVIMVWVSNPVTIPPMFYFSYKFGCWILQEPVIALKFQFSMEWLSSVLGDIWQPLITGCFFAGLFSAIIGYGLVRLLWRLHVVRTWEERKHRRVK